MLKRACPAASVTGLDPDPDVLERAAKKAAMAGVTIRFVQAFLTPTLPADIPSPNKIVSSLVFHQVPLAGKRTLSASMRAVLPPGGECHIADYGQQRTALMRALFRTTV